MITVVSRSDAEKKYSSYKILIAGVCVSIVPHSGIKVECASSTDNLLNSEHRWVQMMWYSPYKTR
jgi:hypothetical protein